MKIVTHLAVCAILVCSTPVVQAAAEYREFTDTEGGTIRGIIKRYNSLDNTVTIERENRKMSKVPVTVFSESDQAYINRWKNREGIRRTSKFKVSCERRTIKDWNEKLRGKVYYGDTPQENQDIGKADFKETGYEISLENRNGYPVKGLYIEYCIYYEQETVPKKDAKEGVYCGSLDIDEIGGRKTETINTDTVVVFEYEKNVNLVESYQLSSKVSGIALRIYVREGDKKILLREETKPDSVLNNRDWAASSIYVGANIDPNEDGKESELKKGEYIMNWLLIVSGSVALFMTIGHFTIGSKQFLHPMLESSFDAVAKKVMHCVFHYVSVFLILTTVALLCAAFNLDMGNGIRPLVRFISINYGAFAAWQLVLACTSGIPKGAVKMFQWIFFIVIAVTGWMGS